MDTERREIHIIHNRRYMEGVKAPKTGSARTVPLPEAVKTALEAARNVHVNPAPDAFIFESVEKPGQPLCPEYFVNALRHCLESIGITEGEHKNALSPSTASGIPSLLRDGLPD